MNTTLCCQYLCPDDLAYPVYWNPYNKVVQCHHCGRVYVPTDIEPKGPDLMEAERKLREAHDMMKNVSRFGITEREIRVVVSAVANYLDKLEKTKLSSNYNGKTPRNPNQA